MHFVGSLVWAVGTVKNGLDGYESGSGFGKGVEGDISVGHDSEEDGVLWAKEALESFFRDRRKEDERDSSEVSCPATGRSPISLSRSMRRSESTRGNTPPSTPKSPTVSRRTSFMASTISRRTSFMANPAISRRASFIAKLMPSRPRSVYMDSDEQGVLQTTFNILNGAQEEGLDVPESVVGTPLGSPMEAGFNRPRRNTW